jgi:hypothetical protein
MNSVKDNPFILFLTSVGVFETKTILKGSGWVGPR